MSFKLAWHQRGDSVLLFSRIDIFSYYSHFVFVNCLTLNCRTTCLPCMLCWFALVLSCVLLTSWSLCCTCCVVLLLWFAPCLECCQGLCWWPQGNSPGNQSNYRSSMHRHGVDIGRMTLLGPSLSSSSTCVAGAANGCVVTLRGVSDADRALVLETCGNEGNGSHVHVAGFPDFGFMQEVTRSNTFTKKTDNSNG